MAPKSANQSTMKRGLTRSWTRPPIEAMPRPPKRPDRDAAGRTRHARAGRAAAKNSADDGKDLAPDFGWRPDLREPERRVVAAMADGTAKMGPTAQMGRVRDRCEGELANRTGRPAG